MKEIYSIKASLVTKNPVFRKARPYKRKLCKLDKILLEVWRKDSLTLLDVVTVSTNLHVLCSSREVEKV